MLEHLFAKPVHPKRVVVMGAGGFVGTAVTQRLKQGGLAVVALTRSEMDLLADGAGHKLAGILQPDDAFVAVSAIAPCKNNAMMVENIAMMASVCTAIEIVPPAHVVYISSDAVYADSDGPLTERSCAEPGSLHGVMHLTREAMIKTSCPSPLAILRPSLLYGAADTHNGYGPNLFRRLAAAGRELVLFGEGEERRDHVLIDDVAEIVNLIILHRSVGTFNVATGEVFSFREVAGMVASHFRPSPAIRTTPRKGPMPHGGYRPFDISACRKAFPEFRYTSLADGIAKAHRDMTESNHG
jgi:UDP-glucose 4-epimerase